MNLHRRNPPNRVRRTFPLLSATSLAAALMVFTTDVRAGLEGHGGSVYGIAVAPDGQTALTAGFDYSIIRWDLGSEEPMGRLMGHDGGVNAVSFVPVPEGLPRQAVSVADDGAVILWNVADGKVQHRFSGHKMKAVSLDVSHDGHWAVSAAWDQTVRLWDLKALQPGVVLKGRNNRVNAAVFSADGETIITGADDGSVRLWNRADGSLIKTVRAHDFVANALAVSVDGGHLVTASVDKTIRLWQLPEMKELALIELHDSAVLGLDISPDGDLLASSGVDGTISLWSIPAGRAAGSMKGHDGAVWALAFSPDGKRLLSAGRDETVRIWDIETRSEINPVSAAGTPAPEAIADMTESEKRGQWHFRKCRVCHSITPASENRAGPTLYGILGRKAGTVDGYEYSSILTGSDIVWDGKSIAGLFELGPDRLVPGSKMPLQRLQKPEDRQDLVNYIRRVTVPQEGTPLPGQRSDGAAQ